MFLWGRGINVCRPRIEVVAFTVCPAYSCTGYTPDIQLIKASISGGGIGQQRGVAYLQECGPSLQRGAAYL